MNTDLKVLGFVLMAFIMLASCAQNELPVREKLVNEITAHTIKALTAENKDLKAAGTGGGLIGDIKRLYIGFYFYHELDLDEARQLAIKIMEKYLSDLNTNEEVRPYLHVYSFPAERIEIDIWIRRPDGRDVSPETLRYVSIINGAVSFYLGKDNGPPPFYPSYEEPYTEAYKIVTGHDLPSTTTVK